MQKKKRGRPSADNSQLTKEKIIECAKRLMLENGKAPSVRGIARQLNVDTMAIYHYFENKNALLEAVGGSLIAQIYEPTGGMAWEAELEQLCKSYLNLLSEYSGLLETLLRMQTHGPAMIFKARFDVIIKPLKLSEENRKHALDLLGDYLHGVALSISCNPSSATGIRQNALDGPLQLYIQGLISSGLTQKS